MNRAIGVFDSGVGGLTVLRCLQRLMPFERYLYLADQAFFPYGVKPFEYLDNRIVKVGNFFIKNNVKAIVVACNTASLHKQTLQMVSNLPVIDVIEPTCNYTNTISKNRKVCLLATQATVESAVYQRNLTNLGMQCVPLACPEFVTLAENGHLGAKSYQVVAQKLHQLNTFDFDTVIFGCTHFSLLQKQIYAVLGDRHYVDCGVPTSQAVQKSLCAKGLLSCCKDSLETQFVTTASAKQLQKSLKILKLDSFEVSRVDI